MRRMFSKNQIEKLSEQVAKEVAEQAIVADKDVISKITTKYEEDGNVTTITFPKGIQPLLIEINTHTLYISTQYLLNDAGETEEEYQLDEYFIDENGCLVWSIVGDISEQVINTLTYIMFDNNVRPIDAYHMYYPASGGTKLYKHSIVCGAYTPGPGFTGDNGYLITLVSPRETAYDNYSYEFANAVNEWIRSDIVIKFNGNSIDVFDVRFLYTGSTSYPKTILKKDGTILDTGSSASLFTTPFTDTVTPL